MALWSQQGLPLKIFVREQLSHEVQNVTPESKFLPVTKLTGKETKAIYEGIVNSSSEKVNQKPTNEKKKKCKRKSTLAPLHDYKNSDIFSMAQNNKVSSLKIMLEDATMNVNLTDAYGWTALMCAACSGAKEVVEILLERGACTSVKDKSGHSALSLAKKNGHNNIVKLLRSSKRDKRDSKDITTSELNEPFYCELCKGTFNIRKIKHECSTLHLLNTEPTKFRTYYGIPESNKGFQILLKEGWNRETGLGPDGSGMKFPIKAKLKNNRHGVGVSVTESQTLDNLNTSKYENKKMRISREMREKMFEKNFRLEFS